MGGTSSAASRRKRQRRSQTLTSLLLWPSRPPQRSACQRSIPVRRWHQRGRRRLTSVSMSSSLGSLVTRIAINRRNQSTKLLGPRVLPALLHLLDTFLRLRNEVVHRRVI